MKEWLLAPVLLVLQVGGVHAADSHDHAHATAAPPAHAAQTPWGIAADPSRAQRMVEVRMRDTMRFEPSTIDVRRGETVRLVLVNEGKLPHEFVLGTDAEIRRHEEMMAKASGAHEHTPHADGAPAGMASVAPGARETLVWTFNRPGTFAFACLMPGHYPAGMRGRLVVH